MIDAGDGTHGEGAAAVESAAVEDLPDILDVVRVAANQVFTEFTDRGCGGGGAPLDDGLTPAANTLVGGDFEKEPAGWHGK